MSRHTTRSTRSTLRLLVILTMFVVVLSGLTPEPAGAITTVDYGTPAGQSQDTVRDVAGDAIVRDAVIVGFSSVAEARENPSNPLEKIPCDYKDLVDDPFSCFPQERGTAEGAGVTCEINGHGNLTFWWNNRTGEARDGNGNAGSFVDCKGEEMGYMNAYVVTYQNSNYMGSDTDTCHDGQSEECNFVGALTGYTCQNCNGTWIWEWKFVVQLAEGGWHTWPNFCKRTSYDVLECSGAHRAYV